MTMPVLSIAATPEVGAATASVEWGGLLMGLLGGLALFLFGMDQMSRALKAVAGDRMRSLLALLTTNRFTGALTGALVTAVIQSSSVTTVLVVGFITAGLMSMSQSIGVIMGANVGTTVTAQIIAFKVTQYALLLVAIGFALLFAGKREKTRSYGQMIMGLGLIFLGMGIMGDAMAPLRSYPPFLTVMASLERPWLGIMVGAAFTALIQSSSATTGIVIVMASQGLIELPAGIALVFGSNIGTCITALLAAIGKPREALRAAAVHVMFNVGGVLVWFGLIDQLVTLVTWLSPVNPDLSGADRLAAEVPRQIANAHTVFNVANTFLFIGFATQFARLAERLVPDRPLDEEDAIRAKYLDLELIGTPSLALDRARLEILHMGDRVEAMLEAILPALFTGDHDELTAVAEMDEAVDQLHGHIVTYLGQISQTTLTQQQTDDFIRLMETTNDLENIGDLIETNLVAQGRQRLARGVTISAPTRKVIEEFHAAVHQAVSAALQAVSQKNVEAAKHVIAMKRTINRLADSAALHEARRLVAAEPNRLPAYTVEVDVLETLKRIYYFAKRMARAVVRPGITDEQD